jgi:hypothetical protein
MRIGDASPGQIPRAAPHGAECPCAQCRRADGAPALASGVGASSDSPAAKAKPRAPRDTDSLSLTGRPLSDKERQRVAELKKRDGEVRAHEAAHLAAAGGLAQGGARFTYSTGPDGRQYAVGGEVPVSLSPGRTPRETLSRAQRLRAAALAPADPSGPDRAIAAEAASMEARARVDLGKKNADGADSSAEPTDMATAEGATATRGSAADPGHTADAPSRAPGGSGPLKQRSVGQTSRAAAYAPAPLPGSGVDLIA